ncbi:MAG: DinB family protein [Fimbriimonadales bacterium]|nr:DinB family protein [Fimbriimonadales bacterium]
MNDLFEVWAFTRVRLDQSLEGLDDAGIKWRQHGNSHTIGEILYHIAGAEHYWAARLNRIDPKRSEFDAKLDLAIHDGFLREGHSPFGESEMNLRDCSLALDYTRTEIKPILANPSAEMLEMPLISPVGDHVTGRQGLHRLVQHCGYHTGQIWMIRSHPGFPKS